MFQRLISRNDDLKRLVLKGYAVAFDTNCLIVRDIPYLDDQGKLRQGAFVTKLKFRDDERVEQHDHQVFFAGGVPHNLDGTPITNLGGGPTTFALSGSCTDVVVERSFSNKPRPLGVFADFFAKIESYTAIVAAPAIARYGATPYTFRFVESGETNSVFKIHDTLSSLAEITDLSARLADDVVAVIGLGGTGAYLLDYLTKTPVKEIRGYDGDAFHVHNAFRSPGRLKRSELDKAKADIYRSRYHSMRAALVLERRYINESSDAELDGVTFAFVCVDKGSARASIFDLLLKKQIPFIDVGLGLDRKRGALKGMARVTYYSAPDGLATRDKGHAQLTDGANDEYRTNVQIAELNALNAALAVIRYKQLRGFYFEEAPVENLLFDVADLKVVT